MSLIHSPSQLDTAIDRGGWYIVIGFPLFCVLISMHSYLPDALKHQTIICLLMATLLGATCGTCEKWRESGSLFAMMFLVLLLPIYLMFAFIEWIGMKHNYNLGFAIDMSLSTIFCGKACRILLSIAVHNFRRSRSSFAES